MRKPVLEALGSTKSKNSERTIPFNDLAADVLESQRRFQLDSGITPQVISIVDDYGRVIGETGNLVFARTNGSVWNEPGIVYEKRGRMMKLFRQGRSSGKPYVER